MVQTWAEKEMRNLRRMHASGISVPEPITLKGHVVVMKFIGTDGWPAPLLKVRPAYYIPYILCIANIQ